MDEIQNLRHGANTTWGAVEAKGDNTGSGDTKEIGVTNRRHIEHSKVKLKNVFFSNC